MIIPDDLWLIYSGQKFRQASARLIYAGQTISNDPTGRSAADADAKGGRRRISNFSAALGTGAGRTEVHKLKGLPSRVTDNLHPLGVRRVPLLGIIESIVVDLTSVESGRMRLP